MISRTAGKVNTKYTSSGTLITRYAKLGNRQVAEDVVHDAYVRVLERSSDTPIEQPRAFLYRTALNLVIDSHRRNALRQVEPLDVLDAEERFASSSPHTNHDHAQRLELLERALAELPPSSGQTSPERRSCLSYRFSHR